MSAPGRRNFLANKMSLLTNVTDHIQYAQDHHYASAIVRRCRRRYVFMPSVRPSVRPSVCLCVHASVRQYG